MIWSVNCVISNAAVNEATTFAITDGKLYLPVVTLSSDDNGKLSQQLKSEFKRRINWNRCQSKTSTQVLNQHLDYLIKSNIQGVNRPFILTFDVNPNRSVNYRYYLPTIKIEDYNVMIDGKYFFDQQIENDAKSFENIRKITTGQGADYTTGCLLNYNYLVITIKL